MARKTAPAIRPQKLLAMGKRPNVGIPVVKIPGVTKG